MKILTVLTYYHPHYSGLTIFAERLADALARRGHEVTVLTSQFDPALPRLEIKGGVTVVRVPPLMRISKGLIMPSMPFMAWKLVRQADVVSLHIPQLDASYLAWIARLMRKPVILTYHCDLQLPSGIIHAIANQASHLANFFAAWGSSSIVGTSQDYADHSRFLKSHVDKVSVISPPVELVPANEQDVVAFRQKFNIKAGERIIGMAARLATEKGVEYLVHAMPAILGKISNVRVLFVGTYQNVVGEEKYAERIMPLIEGLKDHWTFLGNLSSVEMSAFFRVCDVLVVPSVNSTEAFGLVQIEAMISGTPVVASDLPGVRQPVSRHGMGKVSEVGDAKSVANAIVDVLIEPGKYRGDIEAIRQAYDPDTIALEYEKLFTRLMENK